MPVIKHSAVHVTPMKAIEYVINGDKTDECKYVTGINVSENAKDAYEDFRINFEMHTGERFYKQALPENGEKTRVRLHHYIQSFKPGEVTPEKAHEIGQTWACSFLSGSGYRTRYQVLVCTHIDRSHIHNHILVSAIDLDGKRWYDNKATLKKARDKSDEIAKRYDLSIIENPKKGTMMPYTEYIARQNKSSWKDKLKQQIDMLVLSPDVRSISDLAEKLNKLGYETSLEKYLHVKRASDKKRKLMSTLKLGDGYGTEELQYRIENKNVIMPLSQVNGYQGIQREYAFCLREIQFLLFRKKKSSYTVSYAAVRKSADLLWYISKNNIHSVQDFENAVNKSDEKYRILLDRRKELEERIDSDEKVFSIESDFDEYLKWFNEEYWTVHVMEKLENQFKPFMDNRITNRDELEKFREKYLKAKSELEEINREIEKASADRKEAAENYKTYLNQRETDYDRILREMKELYEFKEEGITETYKGDLTDIKYFAEMYKGSVTENTPIDERRLSHEYCVKWDVPKDTPSRNTYNRNIGGWSR